MPHHLLAADLIARGFWAASAGSYDRIILVSPDHFNRSRRPLATTRQDIETPFGLVRNDDAAASRLLSNGALFDESDLFKQEHGIAAVLPFAKYFFPDARIVPIVVSYGSTRADWDAAVAMLEAFVEPGTLVVQSTDYSHYLTQQLAVRRDQETLNVIAANDVDIVARLRQPDHMDSKGSQYIQMRLQEVKKARATVIASRSSAEYSSIGSATTSYIVTVYSSEIEDGAKLQYDDQEIVYFGGDTFIGRWFTRPLADPEIARQVVAKVRAVTAGAPLIVNLEGVLLDDPPYGVAPDLHMMHASLAVPILKALNVRATSLANNHSHDLGPAGLRESVAILKRAGITPLQHMQAVDLGRFGLIAINFIGSRDHRGYPVVKSPADSAVAVPHKGAFAADRAGALGRGVSSRRASRQLRRRAGAAYLRGRRHHRRPQPSRRPAARSDAGRRVCDGVLVGQPAVRPARRAGLERARGAAAVQAGHVRHPARADAESVRACHRRDGPQGQRRSVRARRAVTAAIAGAGA